LGHTLKNSRHSTGLKARLDEYDRDIRTLDESRINSTKTEYFKKRIRSKDKRKIKRRYGDTGCKLDVPNPTILNM
jgi:hypothetical protein